jgi:hypothetical protein
MHLALFPLDEQTCALNIASCKSSLFYSQVLSHLSTVQHQKQGVGTGQKCDEMKLSVLGRKNEKIHDKITLTAPVNR